MDLGMLWAGQDYSQTGQHFQQALALARDIGHPGTLAQSLNRRGNWHLNVEQPDLGEEPAPEPEQPVQQRPIGLENRLN